MPTALALSLHRKAAARSLGFGFAVKQRNSLTVCCVHSPSSSSFSAPTLVRARPRTWSSRFGALVTTNQFLALGCSAISLIRSREGVQCSPWLTIHERGCTARRAPRAWRQAADERLSLGMYKSSLTETLSFGITGAVPYTLSQLHIAVISMSEAVSPCASGAEYRG